MKGKCATIYCRAPAVMEITHGPADDRVTEKVCKLCGLGYLRRPSLRATFRPKLGQRFIHYRFLDNEAFEEGKRDVYMTCVVTSSRRWGSGDEGFTVYYTSAQRYDTGVRKASWYFVWKNVDQSVSNWIFEEEK